MDEHNTAVAAISARVRTFAEKQEKFRVYHGSTNSTRKSERRADNTVDTSGLNHVLEVDDARKTALVEPNVPMDALVAATYDAERRRRLLPLVVMEFPNITVGGGFSGSSGESSSFRHGPFDSTINWVEIVLPSGDVVRAAQTGEHADLFWGAASGFGTLGVVTLLEVQLRDAADYVELTYQPFGSLVEASAFMEKQMREPMVDFVDAIAFSPRSTIVCLGRLVNELPKTPPSSRPSRFTRRRDPWFYLHVEKRTRNTREPTVDHVPLVDYLFRYDRGGFWVAKYAYRYFFTPFNRITRSVLDRYMHTKIMYIALHQSRLADDYIVQDVGVPFGQVGALQHWLDDNLPTYPLWLCPLRVRRDGPPEETRHGLHAEFADPSTPEYLMNFGIWRPGSLDHGEFVRQNRELERKVQGLGGKKWLYAHAYYTEDEFWQSYDREAYHALRTKYAATYLPSVYDKVKVDDSKGREEPRPMGGVRPFQGLYGVYKAWQGGDYLMRSKKPSL
ncbi:hypothetical protein PG999_006409 [Apiospora kogelbergensis]|uniref:Delta(24)-sterol reductase n=1 Tax=Apiospora kogelbergensis TaxID=1337665 RepID=A0AAW0QQP3_9PEZI